MLALLTDLKTRLAITTTDQDPLLTALLTATSELIEASTGRILHRTADHPQEFPGDQLSIPLNLYPFESLKSFEVKEDEEVSGWVPTATPDYIVSAASVLILSTPLTMPRNRARMTYTGGFVLPGVEPTSGQSPLPKVLQLACVEQAAMFYQTKDHAGIFRLGGPGTSQSELGDKIWVPWVKSIVQRFSIAPVA